MRDALTARRRELLAEADEYVVELAAQVREPTLRQRVRASAIAKQAGGQTSQAGLAAVLVLDAGGVSRLAERSQRSLALILALRNEGLWPPRVPSVVLVECLKGHAGRDATENRFLKTCDIAEVVAVAVARRAALLRGRARRGSAVAALVVALVEPGGTVLTSDPHDLQALAAHAESVAIVRI